ncbi:hypothetical protein [uncultured Phocaeicola sp.]|uniref:hypothetical protein n=1 Tax=uncultured Phocaeicola sp. TaxID=990718 RepID=UPI0015597A2B|nr:hypothetical protein [uncultured Phocaeicola sp.]
MNIEKQERTNTNIKTLNKMKKSVLKSVSAVMTSCTTTQTCWPTHKTKSNDNTHPQHLVLYGRRAVIAPDIAKQQDNISGWI